MSIVTSAGLGFNYNTQYLIGTTLQYPKELKNGCFLCPSILPIRYTYSTEKDEQESTV